MISVLYLSRMLLQGPDEMDRMNVGEVKDELKSLKALLLNRWRH